MNRSLRTVVALVVMGLAVASIASANVPVPELSTVPKCVPVSPDQGLTYQVTIVGQGGPINASAVEMRFTAVADTLICWCSPRPTPRPPSFYAVTNVSGVANFAIKAGGCIQYGLAAIPGTLKFAGEIFADGIKMNEFGIMSPDVVDRNGRKATSTPVWDPAGTCVAGLTDAVYHTTPLATNTYDWCTDFNCDNRVTLADGIIVTPKLANAVSCPGDQAP